MVLILDFYISIKTLNKIKSLGLEAYADKNVKTLLMKNLAKLYLVVNECVHIFLYDFCLHCFHRNLRKYLRLDYFCSLKTGCEETEKLGSMGDGPSSKI